MEINHKGTFFAACTPQSSATPLPSRFLDCKPCADLLFLPLLSEKSDQMQAKGMGFQNGSIKERHWTKMRISLYVKINFPAIIRFKQRFSWNILLGAESPQNVLTPSKASANTDRAPFSHVHICEHKLWNMCACSIRGGKQKNLYF